MATSKPGIAAPVTMPGNSLPQDSLATPPKDLLERLDADIRSSGGELADDPEMAGTLGATMFDLPGSEDNSVTVLLPREHVQGAPSSTRQNQEPQERRRPHLSRYGH